MISTRLWESTIRSALALPLNYWAGQKLGAVEFGYPLFFTLPLLAAIWAVILPTLYWLTAHMAEAGREAQPA